MAIKQKYSLFREDGLVLRHAVARDLAVALHKRLKQVDELVARAVCSFDSLLETLWLGSALKRTEEYDLAERRERLIAQLKKENPDWFNNDNSNKSPYQRLKALEHGQDSDL